VEIGIDAVQERRRSAGIPLAAIWLIKPETARREHQRVVTVIDKALPKQRVQVKHHAAMPYTELSAFFQELRKSDSLGRLAL